MVIIKSFGLGDFMGYDLLVKFHQKHTKSIKDGEAPPLYQTLLVKGSFDDSYSTNMMATVANEGYYYTPHIIKR
jgi:penicillin-binding protein 2